MTLIRQKKRSGRPGVFFFIILPVLIIIFLLGGYFTNKISYYSEKKGCSQLSDDVVSISFPENKLPFRFVVLGDTGTGDENQRKVAQSIQQVCSELPCDFVLMLGDNFYPEGVDSIQDPQFDQLFEEIYQPLELKTFAVLGNHDVKGEASAQVYYSLKSPYWRMPNYNYRFEVGPASFFAINTNCSIFQWRKLYKMVSGDDSKWKVVFGHHTLYGSGTHGDANIIQRGVWQTFFQDTVDFYLSGHDHQLEHLQIKDQQTEYIVSGSGGQNYLDPKQKRMTNKDHPDSKFVYQDNGFVMFEVQENQIKVSFYNSEAKRLYYFSKVKT